MDDETVYRIYKKLPSGEWHPWSTQMRDLDYAQEQIAVVREEMSGEYRLAKYTLTPEWVDG